MSTHRKSRGHSASSPDTSESGRIHTEFSRVLRSIVRFRVRTLLVAVTVLCLILGTWVQSSLRQRAAVKNLTVMGCTIRYRWWGVDRMRLPQHVEDAFQSRLSGPSPFPSDEPWVPKWLIRSVGDDFFATAAELGVSAEFLQHHSLRVLETLPSVERIYIVGQPELTDDMLAPLADLSNLAELRIPTHQFVGGGLTNDALRHVGQCRGLRKLNLSHNRFDDDGIEHLRHLRVLEQIDLQGTQVTPVCLRSMTEMRRLKTLWVDFHVTDEGLEILAAFHDLETLPEFHESVSDRGIAFLRTLTNLQELKMSGTAVTDQGLALLESLPQLTVLDLSYTSVTDEGIARVAQCSNLERLILDGLSVSDAGVLKLWGLAKLQFLSVRDTAVSRRINAAFAAVKIVR